VQVYIYSAQIKLHGYLFLVIARRPPPPPPPPFPTVSDGRRPRRGSRLIYNLIWNQLNENTFSVHAFFFFSLTLCFFATTRSCVFITLQRITAFSERVPETSARSLGHVVCAHVRPVKIVIITFYAEPFSRLFVRLRHCRRSRPCILIIMPNRKKRRTRRVCADYCSERSSRRCGT